MNTKQTRSPLRRNKIEAFREAVWGHYRAEGRHDLPWRKTKDAYRILVSEVMLQQTQVPRVIEKYKEFLRTFPTVHVLARARLSDVLRIWNGLGYNRRAKFLHDAGKLIDGRYRGSVKDATTGKGLPGVGPYTRAAVRVFAFNEPHALIETNVRAAIIHHFFQGTPTVHDRELLVYVEKVAEGQDPREWHWALMDYGSHIKKLHKNPARRAKSYVRQSKFQGSLRQVRGAILRSIYEGKLVRELPYKHTMLKTALASLEKDGLLAREGRDWRIA